MHYELTSKFIVKSGAEETWQFFSNAENLPKITPPWLKFTILTPKPIQIKDDFVLDYTLKLNGFLPVHWRTRIIEWSPPHRFADLQVKGPYAMWHHQHLFEPCPEGILCTDRVIYKLPGGPIGRVMHWLMVKKQLTEIFDFRKQVISDTLGWVREVQPVTVREL